PGVRKGHKVAPALASFQDSRGDDTGCFSWIIHIFVILPQKMTAPSFTQRQILAFWLPLAASWALMGVEGPILQAAIARLPNLETQLAAFGIVMSVEIAIESPVIMLLATSTALVTSAQSYYTMRRFVTWVNLLVILVAFLVAFTPLYRLLVSTLMGI